MMNRLRSLSFLALLPLAASTLGAQWRYYSDGQNLTTPTLFAPVTLSIDSGTATENGSSTGIGSLTKVGAGTLVLTGSHSHIGATTIYEGTLRLSGSGQLPNATAVSVFSGAALEFVGASDTIGSLSGEGVVSVDNGILLTVGGNNASTTFSGTLTGGGSFAKIGDGTLTLAGYATYLGATTVSGGTLRIEDGSLGVPDQLRLSTHLWLDANFEIAGGNAVFRDVNAGATDGKTGEILITGSNSLLHTEGNLVLGYENNSTGELVLRDGGRVNVLDATRLGSGVGSKGVLTITGVTPDDYPAMLMTDSLEVGIAGDGEVVIADGGSLVANSVRIGVLSGTTGSISVSGVASTGTASTLIVNGALQVGRHGDGTLEIKDGAYVVADTIAIGSIDEFNEPPAEWPSGTVLVTGAGSSLTSANGILVGALSTGFLTVENGAELIVDNGRIDLTATASDFINPENPDEPLPDYSSSYGSLSIGSTVNEATGAGIINASEIRGGDGFATLVFNHTGTDYHLTRDGTESGAAVRITGSVAVYHNNGVTTLSGDNTHTGGTMLLGGTLILGHAAALGTGDFAFAGGTLDLDGFSATLGEFTLLMEGTIDFGAGRSAPVALTFADSSSSADQWLGELTLLNFSADTDRLNFSSIGGLTAGQLALIRLAGYEATGLDSFGNVLFTSSAIPEPSTAAALAGLLGLAFAVTRRRTK